MNIHVHIERLIMDGLSDYDGQGPVIKSTVEAELTRLIAAQGMNPDFQFGGAVPSVKAEGIQVTNDSNSVNLGHQIARAVYGGIGK